MNVSMFLATLRQQILWVVKMFTFFRTFASLPGIRYQQTLLVVRYIHFFSYFCLDTRYSLF